MRFSKQSKDSAILPLLHPSYFTGYFNSNLEADSWITRMTKMKEIGNFSDQDMIFMVGDYLASNAEEWYQTIGSSKTSWSAFIRNFRAQFISEERVKEEKQGLEIAFNRVLQQNKSRDNLRKLASGR